MGRIDGRRLAGAENPLRQSVRYFGYTTPGAIRTPGLIEKSGLAAKSYIVIQVQKVKPVADVFPSGANFGVKAVKVLA